MQKSHHLEKQIYFLLLLDIDIESVIVHFQNNYAATVKDVPNIILQCSLAESTYLNVLDF